MKRWAMVVAAALMIGGSPLWAAGGIGLTVSYWDTDGAEDDVTLGLKWEIQLADSPVDLEVRVAGFDELEQPGGPVPFVLEATPVEFGFSYNFARGGRAEPYLGVGFGLVMLDVELLVPNQRATVDEEFEWFAVGGFEIKAHRYWSVFLEALYRNVKAEVDGEGLAVFDTLGVDLSGVGVNFGLMYRW